MMSFPKRMLIVASIVLILTNLIVFYLHENLSLSLVLLVSIIEIVPIAANLWYWMPKYKLKW